MSVGEREANGWSCHCLGRALEAFSYRPCFATPRNTSDICFANVFCVREWSSRSFYCNHLGKRLIKVIAEQLRATNAGTYVCRCAAILLVEIFGCGRFHVIGQKIADRPAQRLAFAVQLAKNPKERVVQANNSVQERAARHGSGRGAASAQQIKARPKGGCLETMRSDRVAPRAEGDGTVGGGRLRDAEG